MVMVTVIALGADRPPLPYKERVAEHLTQLVDGVADRGLVQAGFLGRAGKGAQRMHPRQQVQGAEVDAERVRGCGHGTIHRKI